MRKITIGILVLILIRIIVEFNIDSHSDEVQVKCYSSGNLYYSELINVDEYSESSVSLTGDCISIDKR